MNSLQRRRTRGTNDRSIATQRIIVKSILILGAVILLIIFFFGDHGLYQLYRLRQEKAEIQDAIAELRSEKNELEKEKLRLETDYEYIEKLARERYRMAKPGEKVFKVIPDEK